MLVGVGEFESVSVLEFESVWGQRERVRAACSCRDTLAAMTFDRRLARIITAKTERMQRQFRDFPEFFRDRAVFRVNPRHFSGFSRP